MYITFKTIGGTERQVEVPESTPDRPVTLEALKRVGVDTLQLRGDVRVVLDGRVLPPDLDATPVEEVGIRDETVIFLVVDRSTAPLNLIFHAGTAEPVTLVAERTGSLRDALVTRQLPIATQSTLRMLHRGNAISPDTPVSELGLRDGDAIFCHLRHDAGVGARALDRVLDDFIDRTMSFEEQEAAERRARAQHIKTQQEEYATSQVEKKRYATRMRYRVANMCDTNMRALRTLRYILSRRRGWVLPQRPYVVWLTEDLAWSIYICLPLQSLIACLGVSVGWFASLIEPLFWTRIYQRETGEAVPEHGPWCALLAIAEEEEVRLMGGRPIAAEYVGAAGTPRDWSAEPEADLPTIPATKVHTNRFALTTVDGLAAGAAVLESFWARRLRDQLEFRYWMLRYKRPTPGPHAEWLPSMVRRNAYMVQAWIEHRFQEAPTMGHAAAPAPDDGIDEDAEEGDVPGKVPPGEQRRPPQRPNVVQEEEPVQRHWGRVGPRGTEVTVTECTRAKERQRGLSIVMDGQCGGLARLIVNQRDGGGLCDYRMATSWVAMGRLPGQEAPVPCGLLSYRLLRWGGFHYPLGVEILLLRVPQVAFHTADVAGQRAAQIRASAAAAGLPTVDTIGDAFEEDEAQEFCQALESRLLSLAEETAVELGCRYMVLQVSEDDVSWAAANGFRLLSALPIRERLRYQDIVDTLCQKFIDTDIAFKYLE